MLSPQELYRLHEEKLTELYLDGYKWDQEMSLASVGVIMRKDTDIYFFGFDGEIMHNPEGYIIDTTKTN